MTTTNKITDRPLVSAKWKCEHGIVWLKKEDCKCCPEDKLVLTGPTKIDIGCGLRPVEGFDGIDMLDFGQAIVYDVRITPWNLEDNSIEAVTSNHFVEHLTGAERVSFFNELYRVMKPGAQATIITPNWQHACAYGDPTHQWPPMSQWYPLYLDKDWRAVNAPHTQYTCDFNYNIGGSWDQSVQGRNMEYIQMAMNNYTNIWRDLIVTIIAKPKEAPQA